MIRLSKLADYGIVLLSYFVGEPPRVLSARELAGASLLPLPTVAKVLKALARGGLLGSQRGLGGGYRLARPATQISVVDVIGALDGPIAMTPCTQADGGCRLEAACPVRPNWQRINAAVVTALRDVTLAHMRAPLPASLLHPTASNGADPRSSA